MIRLNSHPSGRHFLQIPGPTNVPDRVLRAMDYPTIDHRGPEFRRARPRRCWRASSTIFQTAQPVVIYPASGTGAWEAALVNTLSPGDRVLMFETGHFATAVEEDGRTSSAWSRNSWWATGATAWTPPPSARGWPRTAATRSRRSAWSITRPPPASPADIAAVRRAIDRAPAIPRCCWWTPSPRWARSTTATTSGAWTSPWPARRRG